MKKTLRAALAVGFLWVAGPSLGEIPQFVNYQGRVAVDGVNFEGTGLFKFALTNAAGTASYWSNDGTSTAGSEPAAPVSVAVTKGLYSVLLGHPTVPNMNPFGDLDFDGNTEIFLRVWFNDGTHGSQVLSPDQPLGAVLFARTSTFVINAVPQVEVFVSNGSFTVPQGVESIQVEVWGGGGGGGCGGDGGTFQDPGDPDLYHSYSGGGGGGGGAGAYVKAVIEVEPGATLTVQVGGGGSGGWIPGADGEGGGNSAVGGVVAPGGQGGGSGTDAVAYSRGTNGADGVGGAASTTGIAGQVVMDIPGQNGRDGSGGMLFGDGMGGAGGRGALLLEDGSPGTPSAGMAGADGRVVIWW